MHLQQHTSHKKRKKWKFWQFKKNEIHFVIMNQFHLLAIFCQKKPYGFFYNDEIELNNELEHAIFHQCF